MNRFTFSAILLLISTAGSATPPLPEWAVTGTSKTFHAAGCFIPVEGGVVVSISKFGIQLPIGKPKMTRGMPEEKSEQETPKVVAKRETLEETGLEVNVHEKVATLGDGPTMVEGDTSQQVLLYRCTVQGELPQELIAIDTHEVQRVLILDPVSMRTPDGEEISTPWRFDSDRALLINLLTREPKRDI